jgi:hypothetical protein
MSYGQWKIDEELTFKEFGYYSSELTKGTQRPVKCICESCGIISNKRFMYSNSRHRCKPIIDNKKKCFKCKEFKSVEEFSKNRSNFDGYQKVCKECFSKYDCVKKGYRKKTINYKNSLEHYFNSKLSFLKRKSQKQNIPFNLEKGDLLELYNLQDGKCYYTDIHIFHNSGILSHDSISVERLNPEKGYTKENVVLCSFNINSFKGTMNEEEFKVYLDFILPKLIEYKNKKLK